MEKYYKLTCLKDIPIDNEKRVNVCEKGFSFSMTESSLNYKGAMSFTHESNYDKEYDYKTRRDILSPKIETLRRYSSNPNFVKVEIDLDYADKDLVCPKCGKKSLFTKYGDETSTHDDGVTKWYKSFGLECGLCDYTTELGSICTGTRVSW